jgi:predicted nucleic-acid-binding Zn-ribbon protein
MAESREEVDRALAALQKRLPSPACPMCQGNEFAVGTYEIEPKNSYPLKFVTMTCARCAFTAMHDLSMLG